MFSRGDGVGLTAAAIRKSIAKAVDRLSVPVKVYDTPQDMAADFGIELADDTKGVSYNGRIGLVASNISDTLDAQKTLWHEVFHGGLRRLTKIGGKEYEAELQRVAMANGNVRSRAALWRENFGEDYAKTLQDMGWKQDDIGRMIRLTALEEALADLSGENAEIRGLPRFIAAIQKVLRALGLDELADWLENATDAAALSLIKRARDAVTRGAEPSIQTAEPAPAMARGKAESTDLTTRQPTPPVISKQALMKARQLRDFEQGGFDAAQRGEPRNAPPGPEEIQAAWERGWDRSGMAHEGGGATIEQGSKVARGKPRSWNIVSADGRVMQGGFRSERAADEFAEAEVGVPYQVRPAGERGPATMLIDPFEGTTTESDSLKLPAPTNPDIRFSRKQTERGPGSEHVPDWAKELTTAQQSALRKSGVIFAEPTLKERSKALVKDFGKNFVQGVVDQFAPIKELDQRAYMQARLSKATDGGVEALLLHGKPFLRDGALDVDAKDGGFLKVLQGLKNEHDRFFAWVAGLRATELKMAGKENLLTDEDLSFLRTINSNDKSWDGREAAYRDALTQLRAYNKAVMDIAEKQGLIDGESRPLWESQHYVPFYRVIEDGVGGPTVKSGLVRQYAFKKLKGGKENLNDLLRNTLMNWSHLLSAAQKNAAAKATLEAAEKAGIAVEADEETARQMGKSIDNKNGVVSYLDQGKQRWFVVDDPHLLDAITAMEWAGFGTWMKPIATLKRWVTFGITANPGFKIRNLIRDSVAAIGQNPMSYNIWNNIAEGWKGAAEDQTRASMMAGGGMFRFGTMLEGDRAQHLKRLIESGVDAGTVLDTQEKVKAFFQKAWDTYQEFGDRSENINRAALYKHLIAQGHDHLEASYLARDMLDFSMSGQWAVIRFLTMSVPFLNARLQGIYKLGRAAKEDTARVGYVTGAIAMASLALLMAYEDDDDWKKREDWDRDNFWWFRFGGVAFRIPKPFELGAIGTIAERTYELAFNKEMTLKRFGGRMADIVSQQFSMSPVPQLAKPLIDLYANQDSFTGRPIESMGMERLQKKDRYTNRTTYAARLVGSLGLPDPLQLAQGRYEAISPVQADALLRGYFGWLGTTIAVAADYGIRPLVGAPTKPAMQLRDVFLAGQFMEGMPSTQSRYVTEFYNQAKEIELAYGSYRQALKQGDTEKAKDILESEGDKIRKYRRVTQAKRRESELNARVRQVEQSKADPETKRRLLDMLAEQKDRIARTITANP